MKHFKPKILIPVLILAIAAAVFGAVKFINIRNQKAIEKLPRVNVEAKDVFTTQNGQLPASQGSGSEKGSQPNFKANENPSFNIKLPVDATQEAEPAGFLNKAIGVETVNAAAPAILKAEVLDSSGNVKNDVQTSVTETGDGANITVIKPERAFVPGKYSLRVEMLSADQKEVIVSIQDFTWGVLALNANKSIYAPNETGKLSLAVLDEAGRMVCDASLKLDIKDPGGNTKTLSTESGEIKVNEICQSHDFSLEPDYEAIYKFGEAGTYDLTLMAETRNGSYETRDRIEVKNEVPFDVERISATRIFPPEAYPVTFDITANQDFKGKITEQVPESFDINLKSQNSNVKTTTQNSKVIEWNVDVKKGENFKLEYEYDAPDISPEFYLLGPLQFWKSRIILSDELVFEEARQWQIAADAPNGNGMLAYDEDGNNSQSPHYRTWSGTDLSGEGNLQANHDVTVDVNHTIVEASPTRNEYIRGTLDNAGHVNVQVWDGQSWFNGENAPANGDFSTGIGTSNDVYRAFDISYEATSGDGLVVYESSETGDYGNLKYRTWNGVRWSDEGTIDYSGVDEGDQVAAWVECEGDYDSNNILCAWREFTNLGIYGARWDGSAWQDIAAISTTNGISTAQDFDVAWEGTSGYGMVVYGCPSTTYLDASRYIPGSGWSDTSNITAGGAATHWVQIAGSPNNNYIAVMFGDSSGTTLGDLNIELWDGSVWNNAGITVPSADTDIGNNRTGQPHDVAWEQAAGADRALFVWRDSTVSTTALRYMLFDVSLGQFIEVDDGGTVCNLTEGGAGTTEQVTSLTNAEDSGGPCSGLGSWADTVNGIDLKPNPGSRQIMLFAQDYTQPLVPEAQLWNGVDNGTWLTQTATMGAFEADLSTGATISLSLPTKAYDFAFNASGDTFYVSGTCTAYDQSTSCTDSQVVKVAVNGTLQAQTGTTANGTFIVQGITVPAGGAGSVITVYLDGVDNDKEANAVAVYDGTGNMRGIKLYAEHLTIGSADNQTVTNANLSQCDNSVAACNSNDEDIFFDVDGNNDLTVDYLAQSSQEELYIVAGNIYQPDSGNSGNVATHDLENAGTITANNNAFTLDGDWVNSGTFTAGGSTVTFNGSAIQTITAGGSSFNNVTFNNSLASNPNISYTATTTLTIGGNVTLSKDTLIVQSGDNKNFTVTGTVNGAYVFSANAGTGTVTFSSTVGNSAALTDFDATGSTITLGGNITANAGAGGATATFTGAVTLGADVTINTDNTNDNNVSFTSTINGAQTLAITAGTGTVTLGGIVGGTAALTDFDAAGSTISFGAGATQLHADAGAGGATVTFTGAVSLGANVTIDTDNTNDNNVSFTSTINGAQTLAITAGTGTVTLGGIVGGTAALTDFDAAGSTISFGAGATQLHADAGAGGATVTFTGAVSLGANVTIDTDNTNDNNVSFTSTINGAQTLAITAGTGTVTLGGIVGGTAALTDFDAAGSTISFGAGATQLHADAGAGGATVTFTGAVSLGANVTIDTDNTNDNNVSFTSTINGAQTLAITAGTGTVTLGGIVGGTAALTDFDAAGSTISFGAGATQLHADAGAGGATVTFTGAVSLGANVTIDTDNTNDNNVSFTSTINSADATDQNLIITAGGADVAISGAIGATNDLGAVTIGGNDISLESIGGGSSGVTGATAITGNVTGTITLTGTVYNTAGTQAFDAGGAARTITLNEAATFTTTDDTITFTGAVNSQGAENNAITLNAGTALVTFSGNVGAVQPLGLLTKQGSGDLTFGTYTFAATGLTLSTGTINNGAANSGVWTISGNVTISAGTLKSTTTTFNVGGSWSNSAAFTANGGTVVLNGSGAQTLSGTMTTTSAFNNLTITNNYGTDASDDERTDFVPGIIFSAAATVADDYVINTASVRVQYLSTALYTFKDITWNGQGTGTRIFFRNSNATGSEKWQLKVTGAQSVLAVNVSRSDALVSGGSEINAGGSPSSYDAGNNSNWLFAPPTPPTEFVSIVDPSDGTGTDYTSLASWNTGVSTDLAAATTQVFSGTLTGGIADTFGTIYLCRGTTYQSHSGTIVHATASQILVEGITGSATETAGDFWNSSSTCTSPTDYFTISDGGNSARAVAKCRTTTGISDTATVNIANWTTSEDNYIKIWTDPDENYRHQGVWDESKYRLEVANNVGITISADYVRLDGLQLKVSAASNNSNRAISIGTVSAGLNEIWVSNSILQGVLTGTSDANFGINLGTNSHITKIWNNLIYGWIMPGSSNQGIHLGASSATTYAYNNTLYNCTYGIKRDSGTAIAKNNLAYNNAYDYSGTFDAASTYNITNDTPSSAVAFGATVETGTTDGVYTHKLIDSSQNFLTTVKVGMIVKDSSTNYSYVVAIDSDIRLSLNDDILGSGETYTVYTNMYGSPTFEDEANYDFHLDSSDTVAKNKGADVYDSDDDPNLYFTTDIDNNARLDGDNISDIGADENIAKIYRSVGPSATSALSTGTSNNQANHLTVSGLYATFELPVPDNVGVGDALQYDKDNGGTIDSLVLIDKRLSSQKFRIKTASGGAPVATTAADIDWSIFRAYASLAKAESGNTNADENDGLDNGIENFDNWSSGRDLVANQEQWNIACYANGTTADNTAVLVSDWTTSADNYLKIYTPTAINEVGTSQRHSGVWTTGKYHLLVSNDDVISIGGSGLGYYVKIDGLQLGKSSSSADYQAGIGISSIAAGNDTQISNSIIKQAGNASYSEPGIYANDPDVVIDIWNVLIYGLGTRASGANSAIFTNSSAIVNVSNSTTIGGYYGVYRDTSSGTWTAKNVYARGSTAAFSGTIAKTNCASSDTTADGTSPQINIAYSTANFVNVTAGSEDLHLTPSSALKNVGTDLSNDLTLPFNTDIDSTGCVKTSDVSNLTSDVCETRPRGTTWDIGADEVITKIYRSVGPGAADPLAAGASNSFGISGSTATFTSALPDNVGVGDVIQYQITGTYYLAFIHGRTDSIHYTVKSSTGAVPTATSSNTAWNIYRAFTSLSDAVVTGDPNGNIDASVISQVIDGAPDIVASSVQVNIACYANGTVADTIGISINIWTTSPTNYLKIYTPYLTSEVGTSQRHGGKWDDNKYALKVTSGDNYAYALKYNVKYLKIDGLQIKLTMTADVVNPFVIQEDTNNTGAQTDLSNNIITGDFTSITGTQVFGFQSEVNSNNVKRIWNNIVYGIDTNASIYDRAFQIYSGTVYGYNNTLFNCDQGFTNNGSGYPISFILVNNIFEGDTDLGDQSVGSDYNISNQSGNLLGANSKDLTTASFSDETGKDFHLAFTDTGAKDFGADLSQDPVWQLMMQSQMKSELNSDTELSSDVDGASRPLSGSGLSWDIGADEAATPIYRSNGPSATGDLNTDSRTVSITGNTAVFSGAMPDNVGVGDAIQYDSDGNSSIDAVAFITGRTSNTEYSVSSATGGIPIPTPPIYNAILDDFGRTFGPPPSSNWSGGFSGLAGQWKANGIQAVVDSLGVAGVAFNYWNPATFTDSEVYATMVAPQHGFSLFARLTDPAGTTPDAYILEYTYSAGNGADLLQILRSDNGVLTVLKTYTFTQNPVAGDSFGMKVAGSTITAYYKSGSGNWVAVDSAVDATYAGPGYIGLGTVNASSVIDNFGGGGTIINAQVTANVFRAHTSLANAEAGVENSGLSDTVQNFDDWTAGGAIDADEAGRDIWTNNEQWNIANYANGTTADTNGVAIDSWTTAPMNYLQIYTPTSPTEVGTSQRHNGKWDDTKYNLNIEDGIPLDINDEYARIDGLQISNYSPTGDSRQLIRIMNQTGSGEIQVSHSVLRGHNSSSYSQAGIGLYSSHSGMVVEAWNNLLYNFNSQANTVGIYFEQAGGTLYSYNNTVIGANKGYEREDGTFIVKNSIAQNCNDGFYGTFTSSDYNISDIIDDAPSASYQNNLATDVKFVDEAGNDFHLDPTDIEARNFGADLSADTNLPITTDIDGKTRPNQGAFDIGADEAAKGVYFSVGTEGGDLKTGSPTVTISNGSATFSEAQNGNIGVGDSVEFNRSTISAFADQGGSPNKVRITTSSSHNLQNNDWVFIGQTTNYYGVYKISYVDSTNFDIIHSYTAESGGGARYVENSLSISRKNNADKMHWSLVGFLGEIPNNVSSPSIVTFIARAFYSLSDAVNVTTPPSYSIYNSSEWSTDLAANDIQLNIACYNDNGDPDTDAATVDGWTTSPSDFIKIYTPVDTATEANSRQRHSGKWDDTKYRLEITSNSDSALALAVPYARIDGLQIKLIATANSNFGVSVSPSTPSDVKISNNIITGVLSGSASGNAGVVFNYFASGSRNASVWNNIIDEWIENGIYFDDGWGASWVYNNTVYNSGECYGNNYNSLVVFKNNIAQSCSDGFVGSFSGSDYNISNVSSDAPSASYRPTQATTVAFQDAANADFHLASSDTMARNVGTNLSTSTDLSFATDIDGNGRSLWDIGADEGSVEMEATVMQSGGDYSSLAGWENGMGTDLMAAGTMVFAGALNSTIDDNIDLYLCRSASYQNVTATTVHAAATQLLAESISDPTFVMAANDVWYTSDDCGSSNYFTLSAAGGDPAIAVAKIDGAWTAADTANVYIDGWTTGPQNYIKIYTTAAARHPGKWDLNKYRIEFSGNDYVINAQEENVRLDGLQLKFSASSGSYDSAMNFAAAGSSNYEASNNILWGNFSGSANNIRGIYSANGDNGSIVKIWNNIIYGYANSSDSSFFAIQLDNYDKTVYAYNNTIVDSYYGIYAYSGPVIILKNNIFYNNADNYYGTFDTSGTNNLSGPSADAQIPATNARDGVPVSFVNANEGDFHLANDDTGAKNYGADLAADTIIPITTDIDGSIRPTGSNIVDIGADEAATEIYYSVGQNTADHSLGLGGATCSTTGACTITIDSGTATFNYAQTTINLGVGDKVTYNTSSIAYISEKVSTTEWKLITDVGATPADVSGQTLNSITHATSSLEDMIDAAGGWVFAEATLDTTDLVVGNYVLNIPCYYDSGPDQTEVTIDGWTTGHANYIKIYTPNNTNTEVNQTQRHSGKWDDTKYRISSVGSDITCIGISADYVKIDGLQCNISSSSNGHGFYASALTNGSNKWEVSNNIIRGSVSGEERGITSISANNNAYIWNNIVYDISMESIYSFGAAYVYNNTILHGTYGIRAETANIVTAKNNLLSDMTCEACTYAGTFNANSSNNATDNGDDIGAGTNNRVSQTFSFINETADDFHLAFADTGAKGYGTNLSHDAYLAFQNDIDGQERTGTWTIGADEPREAEVQSSNLKSQSLTDGLVLYQSFDGGAMDWENTSAEARDQSGQGNNGDVDGAVATVGKLGQALSFDGEGNNVSALHNSSLDITSNITLSAWIKQNSTGVCHTVVAKTDAVNAWDYDLYICGTGCSCSPTHNNQLTLESDTTGKLYSTGTITDTNWHHVIFTRSGSAWTFYIDGASAGNGSNGTAFNASNVPIEIGKDVSASNGSDFYGQIDEVRVYNRALSTDEIGDLYRLGQDTVNMSLTDKNKSGLIGMWSFDGADISGANAYDRSTGGHNGTIHNATPIVGKKGQALSFNGSSAYVDISNAASSVNKNQGSFSAWVYADQYNYDTSASKGGAIEIGNSSSSANGIALSPWGNAMTMQYEAGGVSANATIDSAPLGTWYHIAGTWTASTLKIYLNGELADSEDNGALISVALDQARIGSDGLGTPDQFLWDGKIDEVRVYNRALSADEVGDLYNLGSAKMIGKNIVPSYLLSESFDGSTACGDGATNTCNNTWTADGTNNGVFNYATSPAPLEGTYSLRQTNVDSTWQGYRHSFTAQDTVYLFAIMNPVVLKGGSQSIFLEDSPGGNQLLVINNANPEWNLSCGSVESYENPMIQGTTYYVWADYTKGSGANAVCHLYYSTTNTKPSSPNITITNGDATAQAASLWLGNSVLAGSTIFDKIRVSANAIGSNPE